MPDAVRCRDGLAFSDIPARNFEIAGREPAVPKAPQACGGGLPACPSESSAASEPPRIAIIRAVPPERPGSIRRGSVWALFLVFALVSATPLLAASPPANFINLGASIGSVEIVRCHFDEGRLVIRHNDEIHVLRKGDTLEGTGLRVVEITPGSATLSIRQDSPAGSLRIIRITGADRGALRLREYATDPAALASGSAATAPKTPINTTAPGKPKSAPDGD